MVAQRRQTLYLLLQEMKRLKATHPDLDHASAFKMAASSEYGRNSKFALHCTCSVVRVRLSSNRGSVLLSPDAMSHSMMVQGLVTQSSRLWAPTIRHTPEVDLDIVCLATGWVASEAKAAADQAKGEQQPPLQPAELQHGAAQQPPLAAEQQYGHSGSSAQAQQQSGAIDCSDSTGPEEPYLAVGAGASLPTAPAQEHLPEPGPNATGSQAVEADVRQQAGGVDAGHVMERQQQPTTQPAAVAPAAVASVQQPGATPVLTAMPPPAARVASTNSDAVNSHQSAATGPSLDPQPAADSTAGAGSGSEVHVTSAPLTLEQTWQTLCNQHAPTADAHGAHRPNAAPALLQQQQPSACTAAPFAAGSTFGRQQVTTELGPSHTGLKESSPGAAAAAAAAVTSEGSDLASWSSGMTPGQAGHTAADPVLASPGALSGSAANSMPNILRHNSAPITTAVAFVPRQSKPVAYSITTTGPSKPAKR